MSSPNTPMDNQNIHAKIHSLREKASKKRREGYQTSYAERMIDLADFYFQNYNYDEAIGYVIKATKALENAPRQKEELLSGDISFPEPDLGLKKDTKKEGNRPGGISNELLCPGCKKKAEPEWKVCPYCMTPLGNKDTFSVPGKPSQGSGSGAGEPGQPKGGNNAKKEKPRRVVIKKI